MSKAPQQKTIGNPPQREPEPAPAPQQEKRQLQLRGFGFFNPSKKLFKLTFLDQTGEFQKVSYMVFVKEFDELRAGGAKKKDGTEKKSFAIYEDEPPWRR